MGTSTSFQINHPFFVNLSVCFLQPKMPTPPSLLTGPAPFDGPESLGLAGVAPAFSDGMPDGLRPTSNMDPEGQAGSFKDGVSGSLEGEVRSVFWGDPRWWRVKVDGAGKGSLMFPNTWEWRHRSFPGGTYRAFVCVFFLWTLNWGVVLVAE